jgi:hypothetical protein
MDVHNPAQVLGMERIESGERHQAHANRDREFHIQGIHRLSAHYTPDKKFGLLLSAAPS